ncbi:MAG TPA: DUF4340 domain-containing protein [Patescibacteria group bacterium]|nr:DUF4340 domain-containing protein [Patescibacteria group bacterium]
MKLRPGPVAAFLVLAALGVTTWLLEFRGADERHKAEAAKDKPVQFERAALKAIVLRRAGEPIRLQHDGDVWTIREPLVSPADKDAMEGLLSALETGRIERRLGEVADRKPYGLDPPVATVTIETTSGEPQVLALGEMSPIGGTIFALLPGGKEVAVVSAALGDLEKKDLLSLRDKSLLSFDPWKVKSLTIERGRETIALEKPADGWKVVRPFEAPADGPTVTDLLSAVERMRAARYVTEKAGPSDLKTYGLDPPAARMTILEEGQETARTILFGGVSEKTRYAMTVGRDPVVTVADDIWPKVTTALFDLRRKDVLGLGQYRIASVSVARDGGPALVLARQKDSGWTASGLAQGTLKNDSVDLLLREIADVKALAFEDQPAAARLEALSARPPLDVTLEQDKDSDGGEARRQHLVFGAVGKDKRMPVRDLAWRPIFLADGAALGRLQGQLDALVKEAKTPPPPQPAPAAPAPPPAGAPPGAGLAPPPGDPK